MAALTSTVKVKDVDKGYKKILANIKELGGYEIKIGLMGSETVDGVSVVDYAIYNEFGTSRIPARPFMSTTYDRHADETIKYSEFQAGQIINNKVNVSTALQRIGLRYQAKVQATIRDAKSWADPNAPSTIAMKGSSSPLIDTGRMVGAVRYEVRKHG